MRSKITILLLSVLSLLALPCLASGHLYAAPKPTAPPGATEVMPVKSVPKTDRERVIWTAAQEIGVVEATGKNDGARVEAYLRSCGLAKGAPYCAAFVYWVGKQALGEHNPYPRSAWSPDMVERPTWTAGNGLAPQPGDTFGIYFSDKGRVAHTGLIAGVPGQALTSPWFAPRGYFRTIEANTNKDAASGTPGDREGQGVHSKLRLITSVRFVKSWIKS